jgi:hypothetical protein
MANTFQRVDAALGTGFSTAYTVPSSTTAILIGFRLTNIDGSSSVNVEAKIGASGSTRHLVAPGTPLPVGSSLGCIAGGEKVVLEAAEIIELKASAAGDAEAQISILEIS